MIIMLGKVLGFIKLRVGGPRNNSLILEEQCLHLHFQKVWG